MSWFARSLVNSLRVVEEDEDEDNPQSRSIKQNPSKSSIDQQNPQEEDKEGPTRGVKEDITELTKTLTRQFWGVASFLAPPPTSGDSPPSDPGQPLGLAASDEVDNDNSPKLAGIRSDFAEISGRFKSGISMLSNTKAVSEISKIASTFLPFGSEEDEEGESEEVEERYEGGAVGVTDEVLAFARNISMHPETWLDFPLIPDEDDSDEFDMSDAQQEHALAVERQAPSLAALRIELCPSHMSEGRFWKIYFVLLHSRLNRTDADQLTTPQIVQAREMLLHDLQTCKKPKPAEPARDAPIQKEADASFPSDPNITTPSETSPETSSIKTLPVEEPSTSVPITDLETEKHPVHTTEVKIIDKSVIEEDPPIQPKTKDSKSGTSNSISIQKLEEDEEDVDDWLEEEETGEAVVSKGTTIPLGNEDDVSFSDLEDDDDQGTSNNSTNINTEGKANDGNSTSSQNKESNDWLSIDDLDDINVER